MWPVVYPEPYLLVDASSEVPGRAVPQGSQTHLGHLLFGQEAEGRVAPFSVRTVVL